MKIAVVTDDGKTISRHFGRAGGYLVFTIEDGTILEQERREKSGHQQFVHLHEQHSHTHEQGHGMDPDSAVKHAAMIEPIRDCEVVIVRGMGQGAYLAIQEAHIRPIVTELDDAEEAVRAYLDGTLADHPERLH
ncbi:MAG: dinitrogenase iron-molybdenum cofactor biosynthesis protein [Anaerolineae bacterium]|nr:dinitrogenase iron-molybdenum cofactor biosynthesis protein [Anaerolineae bacterium]